MAVDPNLVYMQECKVEKIEPLPSNFNDCTISQLQQAYETARNAERTISQLQQAYETALNAERTIQIQNLNYQEELIDMRSHLFSEKRVTDKLTTSLEIQVDAVSTYRNKTSRLTTALHEQDRFIKLLLGPQYLCCLCHEVPSDLGLAVSCSNSHFICMGEKCLPRFVMSDSRVKCPLCKEDITDKVSSRVCTFLDF